jgi:CheY-like chemotaxis protein
MGERARKKRILIIDNDAEMRRLASRVMELEGFSVLQAENGGEGLKLMREQRCDLVLLDLWMPGRDGWSVLEEIKTAPELCRIPVILFSTTADKSEVEKARSRGAEDFLMKPLSVIRLRESVAQALAEK